MMNLDWMAWTWQTGAFVAAIFITLGVMTVLAIRYPETERHGLLRIGTTRGDRLFLSLLSAAILHLVWIGFFGSSVLWGASIASLILAVGIFGWV